MRNVCWDCCYGCEEWNMTVLHFIEAVIGIWIDYWPWFVFIALGSLYAGFVSSRRNR